MAHSASSPTTAVSGTPVQQKKKLTWDEYHERLPRKTHGAPAHAYNQEEAEWQEKLRKQQEELAARQDELDREVDRLKREQEALAEQAGRQQLERLQARQKQQCEERRERERQEKEQQESRRWLEQEQEKCQAAARVQQRMGSHTPVTDEHGEMLDYYCDKLDDDPSELTWERVLAETPINQQLAQLRQDQREEAALQGPTQAVTPAEEEKLLAGGSGCSTFMQLVQGLEGLPESALCQLSQHIKEIHRRMPTEGVSSQVTQNPRQDFPSQLPRTPKWPRSWWKLPRT